MASETGSATTPIERLEQSLLQKIETGEIELPLLPQAASQVMALASDPAADAAKLSALIHQDQALAAHVLRVANSPAYMSRSPVVSLQHAVAMLGITLLSEIAFTASLKSGAFKAPGHEDDVKRLWRHSLATGAFAKEIARMRRVNVESAYLCGLLHEIGKPVVLQTATALAQTQRLTIERAILYGWIDGYHSRVGTLIAEKWGLPKQVATAIQYYDDYDHADSFRQECLLTCASDRLASHVLAPEDLPEESLRTQPAFAELNLYPNDIDQLLTAKGQVLAVVNALTL